MGIIKIDDRHAMKTETHICTEFEKHYCVQCGIWEFFDDYYANEDYPQIEGDRR